MEKNIEHSIYKRSKSEKSSDACAWVFSTTETFEKYYYQHPPLDATHIRCRVLYAGLCMSDCLSGRGKWGDRIRPLCPGHEVIAEVTVLGKDVTNFKVGEKVGFGPFRDSCGKCEFCEVGKSDACCDVTPLEKELYSLYFGGYSTHIQQPVSHAYKIPSKLDIKLAAPLLCAGVTVYAPLYPHLKPGMKVGVIGIGGLGHLAVQYANKMGADVLGFTTSEKKKDFIMSLGAKGIVLWKSPEYHTELLNSFDILINTIPGNITSEEFSQFSKVLKPYGKFIQVGIPNKNEKFSVNYADIVVKQISIIGSNVGGRFITEKMLEFSAENGIECLCEEFQWEDFPKALDKLENGKPIFRCVVDVGKESSKYD